MDFYFGIDIGILWVKVVLFDQYFIVCVSVVENILFCLLVNGYVEQDMIQLWYLVLVILCQIVCYLVLQVGWLWVIGFVG